MISRKMSHLIAILMAALISIGSADCSSACLDTDNDGWCESTEDSVSAQVDCNDKNPVTYPGAREVCDGQDNDCNGFVDDGLMKQYPAWPDNDLDGHAHTGSFVVFTCGYYEGMVDNILDCDDNDPDRNFLLPETCDGKDNDCNDLVDDGINCPEQTPQP